MYTVAYNTAFSSNAQAQYNTYQQSTLQAIKTLPRDK